MHSRVSLLFCSVDLFLWQYYAIFYVIFILTSILWFFSLFDFITMNLKYSLKSGVLIPLALFFFAQDCFCYLESFVFPYEFRIFFCKKYHWDFGLDCIKSINWAVSIFTIFILPIHENEKFFHLLLSFSSSFFNY